MQVRYSKFILVVILIFFLINSSCNRVSTSNENFSADTLRISDKLRDLSEKIDLNYDSACEIIVESRIEAQKIGYTRGIAITYYIEGIFQLWNTYFDFALESFRKSQEAAFQINDSLFIAKCYEQLATIHFINNNNEIGFKYLFQALRIYESLGYSEGMADVCLEIGLHKCSDNEIEEAKKYMYLGFKHYYAYEDEYELALKKTYLGNLYTFSGEYNNALHIFKEVESTLIDNNDVVNLSRVYYGIALVFQKLGHIDSSFQYIDKSLRITDLSSDWALLNLLYGIKGELYVNKMMYDSASLFLDKSIFYSNLIGDFETKLKSMNLQYVIDTIHGNYRSAINRLDQILHLKDSLNKARLDSNLRLVELEYESVKNLLEIEKKDVEIHSAKNQNNLLKLLIFILIINALAIGIIIMLKIKSNRYESLLVKNELAIKEEQIINFEKGEKLKNIQIQMIEESIRSKQREQVTLSMAITQKQEIVNFFINSISKILNNKTKNIENELSNLVRMLKNQSVSNENIDVFNEKFTELHTGFFERLKEAHPELSKSDLKFCAYLRLNICSHQLVMILNVTNEAIRKTRYRIRKKMNLRPDESLEDYISAF